MPCCKTFFCAVLISLAAWAGESGTPPQPPKLNPNPPPPVAPAADAPWEKIETKFVALPVKQIQSPGLFDRTLMSIVAFQPPPPPPVLPNKNAAGAQPAQPPAPPPGPPPPPLTPELKLPRFGKDAAGKPWTPFIARYAQEFIWVDFDADSKPGTGESKRIGPDGYTEPYSCDLHYDDGTSGKYNFCFKMIAEKEQYALVRSCGRVFEYQKKHITLLDDDGNGKYNDLNRDSVWVEGQPVAQLGKHILIGDALYELIVQQSGGTVEIRPAATGMAMGAIDAFAKYEAQQKSEQLKLHTVIFTGSEGSFACDEKNRVVKVPAGPYDMVFGLFERNNEIMFMKKGEKTSFAVLSKVVAQPKWGGKVVAHFPLTSDGEEVTLGAPRFYGIATEEYIPEYHHANNCSARIAMVFHDKTHFDIESFVNFGSRKFDTLSNGEWKPIIFKRYRNVADEYEGYVEYTSGIIGRIDGRERLAFVYKKKDTKPPKQN